MNKLFLVLALVSQIGYGRAFKVVMSSVPAAYSASNAQSRIMYSDMGQVKNVCCYNPEASTTVAISVEGTASVAPSNDTAYIPAGVGKCTDVRGRSAFYIRGMGSDGTGATITSGKTLLCDYTLAQ